MKLIDHIYIPLDLGTFFFQGIYDKVKLYPEDMVQTCVLTKHTYIYIHRLYYIVYHIIYSNVMLYVYMCHPRLGLEMV